MSQPSSPDAGAQVPTCYRHPDRATYVRCNRCGRPVCPECMRSAAVGHQCVDCVQQGMASVRQPTTQFGGTTPADSKPIITWTLIGLNALMFALQLTSNQYMRQLSLWPVGVADGQWWRLITSGFIHVGVMHILFNMWALYVVGPPLERWLGRRRFAALYGLSLLGGSTLVYLLSDVMTPTVGASGAIFGLFGATFVIGRRLNLNVSWIVGLIVINLVITFGAPAMGAGPISWQGHLGGLITGLLVSAAFAYAPRERRNAVLIGVTVGFLALFAILIWWRTGVILDMFTSRVP